MSNNDENNIPFEVMVNEGEKVYWCTCGLSGKQPYCDGSHKGTANKSLHFIPENSGTVWLCGCKQTKNPPYCDGSHLNLEK